MSTPHDHEIASTTSFKSALGGIPDAVIGEHAAGVLDQIHPDDTSDPHAVLPPRPTRSAPTTSLGERARNRATSREA